jgi:hypothetical protein
MQKEVKCANLTLNPNHFLHFVYFNFVHFVFHWNEVKIGCGGFQGLLITLLHNYKGFFVHGVMNSLGVVYPQYWLYSHVEESFHKQLDVTKTTFCHHKKLGNNDVWVCEDLSIISFDI